MNSSRSKQKIGDYFEEDEDERIQVAMNLCWRIKLETAVCVCLHADVWSV